MDKTDYRDMALHLSIIGMILLVVFSSCSTLSHMSDWRHFPQDDTQRYKITEKDLAQFTDSLRPRRQDPDSLYQQARYFQRKGKHKLALQLLTEAILANPAHVKAYNAMGVSYDCLGDYPRAIEGYKRALKLNPELAYVQNNLGYSYFLQGNLDAAIDAFKKAIDLDGENAKYHNNLGLAYSTKGSYDLALIEFEMAADEAKAHYNIGKLYHRSGRHQEAEIHLATASKLNPHITETGIGIQSTTASAEITKAGADKKEKDTPPGASYHVEIDKKGREKLRFKIKAEHLQTLQIDDSTMNSDVVLIQNELKPQDFSQEIEKEDSRKFFEVEVSNGNGVNHMARRIGNYLGYTGLNVTRLTNAKHFNFAETKIYYHNDHFSDAVDVAKHIPGYQQLEKAEEFEWPSIKIRVLIGKDIVPYDKLFRKSAKES